MQASSILNYEFKKSAIIQHIKVVKEKRFKYNIKLDKNPYKENNIPKKLIVDTIKNSYIENIELKKQFYDIELKI